MWRILRLGLTVLALGVREVRLQRRLRREGHRVWGTVTRYKRRDRRDGHQDFFAAASFADENGHPREVSSASAGNGWPIGRQVPVVYLPDDPSTARIDLSSERRWIAFGFTLVAGFTIVPIVLSATKASQTGWVFAFLVGLAILTFGVREVRLQRRLRREGHRTWGTVTRYKRSDSDKARDFYAVVGFADENGHPREVSRVSASTRRWPIGRQVPVVYLPDDPSTARIDLSSERRWIALVFTLVAGSFTIVPIVVIAFELWHQHHAGR